MRTLALAVAFASLLGGCASQSYVERHYYEPTSETALRREDGTTVGAVKAEIVKSGSPDWSGNKSFSLVNFGR